MFVRWLRSLLSATLVIAFLVGAGLSYLVGEVLSLKSLVFVLGLVAAVNYIAAGVLDSGALTGRTRTAEDVAASKGLWSAAGCITLAGLATVYSVFTFWKDPAAAQFEAASLAPSPPPPAVGVKGLASASYSPQNEISMPGFSSPEPAPVPAAEPSTLAVPAITSAPIPALAAPLSAKRAEPRAPVVRDVIPFSPEH
jgi:hypothetical protein